MAVDGNMVVMIAAVGQDMGNLLAGAKEFKPEKVVLISFSDRKKAEAHAKKDLQKRRVKVETVIAKGNVWEETFKLVSTIKKANEGKELLINVSTGDKLTRCAMTSASFVNGLKAFSVMNGKIGMLPILKFSYYSLITDRKMAILKTLYTEPNCCTSLEELSRKCGMSLPLVSYHVNGGPKSEGLKEMALVETTEKGGKISIRLSLMGRLLMGGYVD